MSGENALTVHVYASGSTEVFDMDDSLAHAEVVSFETFYPGGLFGSAEIFCSRDVTAAWLVKENQRIVIKSELCTVYEGKIISIKTDLNEAEQGMTLICSGFWGEILKQRYLNKRWADARIDVDAWPEWGNVGTAYTAIGMRVDKFNIERVTQPPTGGSIVDCIKFIPKGVAFTANEFTEVAYLMPAGQTIEKVTLNYEFAEGTQSWDCGLMDWDSNSLILIDSSATAATSHTLATPATAVGFWYRALANQTPTEDGTYHAKMIMPIVYSETSSINLCEIAKDVVGTISDLSTDISQIGTTGTLSLVPFITDGYEDMANILIRAASYGDAAYHAWAAGVRESDLANDSKPILFTEQQPALTDYDYVIRLEEENLIAPITFIRSIDELINYIVLSYNRADAGGEIYITPDDDANLKDTTSINAYGQREKILDVGDSGTAVANAYARRYLTTYKDPRYYVSGPINVKGYIRTKSGAIMPSAQIRAGKRLKIENYMGDLSGTGLTMLISQTVYRDEDGVCSISCSIPDDLIVFLARHDLGKI